MPIIMAIILVIVSVLGNGLKKPIVRNCLFLSLSILFWYIADFLFYVLSSPWVMEIVYDLKLAFVSLSGVFVFKVIVCFYKLNKFMSRLSNLLFIVPLITAVLSFAPMGSELLRTNFEVISLAPLNQAVYGHGVWFIVNTIFTNVLVVFFGFMAVFMHYKLPKGYRSSSKAFILAVCFYVVGYGITFFIYSPLDFILIGCSLGTLSIYYVVANNERGDYLTIAHREIFNYLNEAVFILDEKGRIVDVNKEAVNLLSIMGKKLSFVSFSNMLELLENEGYIEICRSEDDTTLRLLNGDLLLVYEMAEMNMCDKDGNIKGKFVTLNDVTRTSLFIDRLEIDAGVDPLTGLQNRYTYEELVVDLNKEEHLPISVIVGDVNSLKFINDNYGHTAGDTLLSSVGDVMRECCPKRGYAARLGGDEFVIMVPNCHDDEILRIADDIRHKLSLVDNLAFVPHIALGCVTKTEIGGSLKDLVNEADIVMYFDKSKCKETRS
jgi:diguanylate cyclase (GGDEF)-like protein